MNARRASRPVEPVTLLRARTLSLLALKGEGMPFNHAWRNKSCGHVKLTSSRAKQAWWVLIGARITPGTHVPGEKEHRKYRNLHGFDGIIWLCRALLWHPTCCPERSIMVTWDIDCTINLLLYSFAKVVRLTPPSYTFSLFPLFRRKAGYDRSPRRRRASWMSFNSGKALSRVYDGEIYTDE
jgi:hypothetical protein